MSEFSIEVVSKRLTTDNSQYGYNRKIAVEVTKAEIYEAISNYLQVKGFDTEIVCVKEATK